MVSSCRPRAAFVPMKMGEVYAFKHSTNPIEFKMYYSV